MSEDKNHIDLLKYLRGEMSPSEAHAFEKKALDDPFLTDAMEGAESIGPEAFEKDLQGLNERLSSQPNASFSYLKIAAVIALLILGGYSVWFITSDLKSEEIARTDTENEPEIKPEEILEPEQENIAPQEESQDEMLTNSGSPAPVAEPKKEIKIEDSASKKDKEAISDIEVDMEFSEMADVAFAEVVMDAEDTFAEEEPEEMEVARTSAFFKARKQATGASERSTKMELQKREVKGTVSDDFGDPLPGVNVIKKGTTEGTTTDLDGNFTLTQVDDSTSLEFNSIGMESLSITLGGRDSLNVKLREDEQALQEVVVVGYGAFDNEPEGYFGASPVIGHSAFKEYLEKQLVYPDEARDKGIEGRVVLQLTISPIGQITNIEVKRGIGSGCDEEAIRLVEEGPAWSPATQDGLNVETKVRVKVKFELE